MAVLKLCRKKLRHNYNHLDQVFREKGIDWGIVTKLLCGEETFLKEVLDLGVKEIHDSRVTNLIAIKNMAPDVQTVYIKPAPKQSIPDIIKYADVSFQTELDIIRLLSEEAVRQNRLHKIIIMIEMGDLREGVMGEDLVDFYEQVFKLPGISVIGLGANFNCLHGVMPTQDKLIQLSLYKQIIDAKFNIEIPWVSGGTSVTIPLLFNHQMPKGINHFRIGEALFFGLNLFTGETFEGMHDDVFELSAEIIELNEKPMIPTGMLAENPSGESFEIDESLYGKTSHRAILDVGLLDINPKYLISKDESLHVIGASSDMLVVELGENELNYKVGDVLRFNLRYMGALSIMNSRYIAKEIVE
ncbi:alanine/ornithine racemase family PLP-dependent enzyme [Pontibacter sp. JH31]|uniref:Alanine/ornithine racemase family PLP-dependent enzyme n=1 Tax=Pontibacter aquaedesilientis TaxID=2766980 RepID=A0ABR7XCQ8_9BACT|nr:alanine/ornithine racemase family PLP-dependent enzyme [Pontibacter aquaedesilientis]MBD1396081.1 alanine/ornithine racemase family PLP-dependent enzyme [Pontibacter aquaedesilientis]